MTKKPVPNPKPRRSLDWFRIEAEYRAGQLSVREIGRQHGISDAGILKHARKHGWQRDLSDKVRQETRARLAREDEGGLSAAGLTEGSQPPRAREAEAIDVAASRGVEIVRQHRRTLRDLNDLGRRLQDELDATTTKRGELVTMIEEATKDDKTPQRRNAMMRAMELPGRIGAFKDLSMAVKNLLPLERQAFGLDDVKDEAVTLESLIRAHLPASTASVSSQAPDVVLDETSNG